MKNLKLSALLALFGIILSAIFAIGLIKHIGIFSRFIVILVGFLCLIIAGPMALIESRKNSTDLNPQSNIHQSVNKLGGKTAGVLTIATIIIIFSFIGFIIYVLSQLQ